MKASSLSKYGLIGVGLLLAGWLVFAFRSQEGATHTARAQDPTKCRLCGKELPKQFQASGECPYCKAKPGSKPGAGTWSGGPLVTGIFVCIFLLLAGTHLVLFLRERKKTETTDNEPSAYYHCPKCKRKIRYKVSLAGRAGRCPTCSKPILFPPIN